MNTLQTFKLWLEPDRDFPRFHRLRWSLEAVSLRDVLLHGVHPWAGQDKHHSLPDAVLRIINDDEARPQELAQFNYCLEMTVYSGYMQDRSSKFERTLRALHDDAYFVDELGYLELLDIAKAMLRSRWCHFIAREMARMSNPGFQELRQFLKSKDKQIKLSSYEDVD
jgi:hypothetical protein